MPVPIPVWSQFPVSALRGDRSGDDFFIFSHGFEQIADSRGLCSRPVPKIQQWDDDQGASASFR
ncbi:hypothetical protein GJ654_09725 [Rhodoblastus acidophilus]|uniref:Uncharacterized protein n=1 Tax=Rhodoblastus acidophilus TaxID=1074 RepID=A0A6N8DL20_RHOAC|nr:hypothetical protein [Rhodoblastus acidophilus]MCW2274994.1 hypothetical protein [Rhodoblastus acidophilus]MTV31272.1 hypothetical protein [Rhodoblastus acidophilus]